MTTALVESHDMRDRFARYRPTPIASKIALAGMWKALALVCAFSAEVSGFGLPTTARPTRGLPTTARPARGGGVAAVGQRPGLLAARRAPCAPRLMAGGGDEKKGKEEEEEGGWTIDKVAALGLAGVLSIAVAETVFWVRSVPEPLTLLLTLLLTLRLALTVFWVRPAQ